MRNYEERWKVRKTAEVISFETRVTINAMAIKIIVSELTVKIILSIHVFINYISDKASQLYEAMVEIRNLQAQQGHQGRPISEVGPRQQHRHIKDLR